MNEPRETTTSDLPLLLTVRQAATLLQLGINRTYELVRAGVLPSIHVGHSIRVPRAALERWIDQHAAREPEEQRWTS